MSSYYTRGHTHSSRLESSGHHTYSSGNRAYSSGHHNYQNEPGVTYTVISDATVGATSRVTEGSRSIISEPTTTHATTYVSEPARYTTGDHSQWYTGDTVRRHDVQQFYRNRLERFFQKYDPSKLSKVGDLLFEHRDKEPMLLFDLVKQYGEEPAANEVLRTVAPAVTQQRPAATQQRTYVPAKPATKKAIISVDIQNDYFPKGKWELAGMEEAGVNAAKVLAAARRAGDHVVHIRHEFPTKDAPFFVPGSKGAEIHPVARPLPNEPVVLKHDINSFKDTNLKQILDDKGVEEVVVLGAMSHMCVDAVTRASADFGYKVTVIHDACASKDLELNGETVPAKDVHAAYMSALGFAYADMKSANEYVN